jgi:hypothetical protein
MVSRLDFTSWWWYIPWFDEVGDRWWQPYLLYVTLPVWVYHGAVLLGRLGLI